MPWLDSFFLSRWNRKNKTQSLLDYPHSSIHECHAHAHNNPHHIHSQFTLNYWVIMAMESAAKNDCGIRQYCDMTEIGMITTKFLESVSLLVHTEINDN